MMCIAKDTVVAMRYVMRNARGEVLEDAMHGLLVERPIVVPPSLDHRVV